MKRTIFRNVAIPRFKRWTRRPYGIFASLHRRVEIGVLAIGMSILLKPDIAMGCQLGDTTSVSNQIRLEQIDIRGSKASPTPSAMPQITLYSRSAEAHAPFRTLESVLRTSPAVDVRERGGMGTQADIAIRGGSFDQTMVMLNGINFSDARTGHQTHSLPIDLETVGAVELLDDVPIIGAYAGAIDVRTAVNRSNTFVVSGATGAYGYRYGSLSGNIVSGPLYVYGAASVRGSDGYRHNTGFDNRNVYARAIYRSSVAGYFDFQAGCQNRDFGANGFYSLKYPDQFEHTETRLASLRYIKTFADGWSLSSAASYRRNRDRFELIKGDPSTVPFNYHLTDNVSTELLFSRDSDRGRTIVGGDYTFNGLLSTVLGTPLSSPVKADGYDDVYYTRGKNRHTGNVRACQTLAFGSIDLSATAAVAFSSFGTVPLGSISARYSPSAFTDFDIGYVRSMRLPTFTDLYYTARGYVGNADLKPEKSSTFRIGGRYDRNGWSAVATVYCRFGSDIIDWVKENADDDWHSRQITSLTTTGAELYIKKQLQNSVLDYVGLTYGHIVTDKESPAYISKYALDYMRNKLSVRAATRPIYGITLSVQGTIYDRNGNYTDAAGVVTAYKPYFLLDGRIGWNNRRFDLHVEVTNIASTEYFDYGGLKMPGRWITAGLSYSIF